MEEVLATAIGNAVNSGLDPAKFAEAMNREHRTLQQMAWSAFATYMQFLADLPENRFDARNEYAVKISRKMLEGVDRVELNAPLI